VVAGGQLLRLGQLLGQDVRRHIQSPCAITCIEDVSLAARLLSSVATTSIIFYDVPF